MRGSRVYSVAKGRRGCKKCTAANVRLHLARHSSPPVPGAVTSGYLLFKDAKVASGIPVAAFRMLLGTCITYHTLNLVTSYFHPSIQSRWEQHFQLLGFFAAGVLSPRL
jgi:hypothetical protein